MVVNSNARTLSSDLDQPSPARFTIATHDDAACALDVNPHIRGCIATAVTGRMVKIWNVQLTSRSTETVRRGGSALSPPAISEVSTTVQ